MLLLRSRPPPTMWAPAYSTDQGITPFSKTSLIGDYLEPATEALMGGIWRSRITPLLRVVKWNAPSGVELDPSSFFSVSVVIAGLSRSYLVDSTKPLTPTSSGIAKSLPFLRGHTSPYRQDPRFVLFNPVLGKDWASPHTSAFKIYADKTKGLGSGEILTQFTTLVYPSGLVYPHIISASSPLSKLFLGDILPMEFVTSVSKWS